MKKIYTTLVLLLLLCSSTFALSLSWKANPSLQVVTEYKIYRVSSTNVPSLVGTVAAPTLTFVVDPFLNSNRVRFQITAVNSNGESQPSGRITVQKH